MGEKDVISRVLNDLLSTNYTTRMQAQEAYDNMEVEAKLLALLASIRSIKFGDQQRKMATELLKELCLTELEELFLKFSPESQQELKEGILLAVQEEQNTAIRMAVNNIAARVACALADKEGYIRWPEFLHFLLDCCASGTEVLKKSALQIFTTFLGNLRNGMAQYLVLYHQMVKQSLMDGVSYQVRLEAVRLICDFTLTLLAKQKFMVEKNFVIHKIWADVTPQMLKMAEENAERENSNYVLENFVQIHIADPQILRKYLHFIINIHLKLISNVKCTNSWQEFSWKTMVTLAETEPAAFSKISSKSIMLLVPKLRKVMTHLLCYSNWRATMKNNNSNAIIGKEVLDRLASDLQQNSRNTFTFLEVISKLRKISDFKNPINWYPQAREIKRKIIFHAGPTNSGKTYQALQRFIKCRSGVYCGPLKLLAYEVFNKCNEEGTPCDLVTGDERIHAKHSSSPSRHISCTIEMTSLNTKYDVAVIDEIQMIAHLKRGWAWTRALLGIVADEIHLCGEECAIQLVQSLMSNTGEDVEVRRHDRLTELELEKNALESLDKVQPGDCIVCFNKTTIQSVTRELSAKGKRAAVIYGDLPPGTKLSQARKFNDPGDACDILVATDAIGMGLNLTIRRIIFYQISKLEESEKGKKEVKILSVSQALQIAGRAGRHGTGFEKGFVTTFRPEDLPTLQNLLSQKPEPLIKAGLHPTVEHIEEYAALLPNQQLSKLMEYCVTLSSIDGPQYFICNTEDFKILADMIEHVPLHLKVRYEFCCAPIKTKRALVQFMFVTFAQQYSQNKALTWDWLCEHIHWQTEKPETVKQLNNLEETIDVLNLYLWLSCRFRDHFRDTKEVHKKRQELDELTSRTIEYLPVLKNVEEQ